LFLQLQQKGGSNRVKRNVRIIVITVLLVLMAVLLASCGGQGASSNGVARSSVGVVAPMLDPAILLANGYYVQVHTALNLAGEVRGQVIVPPGAAGVVTLVVPLSGAGVVPPVATNGTGTGTLVVDLATGAVVSSSVTVTGLSSVVTAAHIHLGAPGVNGAIVVTITNITVV
jgi:CHRD domain-containing protein